MAGTRTDVGLKVLVCAAWLSTACGDSSSSSERDAADASVGGETGAAQTPPMGADKIEAWLAQGAYKTWRCEGAIHASRSPSPHGFNRICSNDLIADNAAGSAAWPEGAAAVKELYDAADASTPIGYAVYLKVAADSAGGANWYWYERVPLDSAAPDDGANVVADSLGDTGPAKSICVSCHLAAGLDAAHTPSAGARDQVYTPVQ